MPMRISAVFKAGALVLVLTAVAMQAPPAAAASVHKCIFDGAVTYQGDPCPAGVARQAPTVRQLNAERRKRQAQAGTGTAAPPAAQADGAAGPPARPWVAPSAAPSQKPMPTTAATPVAPQPGAYRCDGRTHCSQMRSCAEARFFLANCPGVQMDGNHDGQPCERQWCKRWQ